MATSSTARTMITILHASSFASLIVSIRQTASIRELVLEQMQRAGYRKLSNCNVWCELAWSKKQKPVLVF